MAGLITSLVTAVGSAGAGGALMVGGTILSGVSSIAAGNQSKAAADYEAAQLDAQGKAEQAAAQREAVVEEKKKTLALSRARAVGAASGGGADINLMGAIEEQGTYNQLAAVWEGQDKAAGLGTQANATRWEGKQKQRAGWIDAGRTLLSGGASFMDKYG